MKQPYDDEEEVFVDTDTKPALKTNTVEKISDDTNKV